MKPVQLKGFLDHSKETFVEKQKNGERGVEVVTPFYTHLNGNDEPCAILVNRGWLPWDLRSFRYDKSEASVSKVEGILYRGDPKTKYSKPNQPAYQEYHSIYPEQISVMCQLPNVEEASQFMLKSIDFDETARTVHPTVDSPSDLG
jgi:cytochrome oxidase assembly protein ShyY1